MQKPGREERLVLSPTMINGHLEMVALVPARKKTRTGSTSCASCHQDIPPGRPGRKCKDCREAEEWNQERGKES